MDVCDVNDHAYIRKQFIAGMPTIIFGFIIGYLFYLLYAKFMPVKEYGAFGLWISLVQLFAMAACLGFNRSAVKFIALYNNEAQKNKATGLYIFALSIALVCSVIASIGIYHFFVNFYPPSSWDVKIIAHGIWLLPLFSIAFINEAFLSGYGLVLYSIIPTKALSYVIAIALSLLLFLEENVLTGYAGMLSLAIAILVAVFVQTIGLLLSIPKSYFFSKPHFDSIKWMRTSLPIYLSNASFFMIVRGAPLIITALASLKQVGIYFVAFQVTTVISVPRAALIPIMSPKIVTLYHEKNTKHLQHIIDISATYCFYSSLAIAIVIFLASHAFINFLGDEYKAALPVINILIVAATLSKVASISTQILNLTGFQKLSARTYLFTLVIYLISSVILIKEYGAVGAAWAFLISILINKAIFIYLVHKKTKINMLRFLLKGFSK